MSTPRDEPAGTPSQAEPVRSGPPGQADFASLAGAGLAGLLEQARQAIAAQHEAANRELEGVAGGGAVRIRATGAGQVLSVRIDPEVVDPGDVEMLEDMVLAALHDLAAQTAELAAQAVGDLGGLLGGAGLGDLLGGGGLR